MIRLAAILAVVAAPAAAQQATSGAGAMLRALDKIAGVTRDVEVPVGATVRFGRIEVDLADCRYRTGNPAGDAYALLRVRDPEAERTVFQGWMLSSSPALNALDHHRYDVWVLRCTTS